MLARAFNSRLALLVLVAAAYALVARLGLMLASLHGSVSPMWPATGLAIAVLMLGGARLWPAIAIGVFITEALKTDAGWAVAAGIAVGNTLEALAGAWLWRRVAERWPELGDFAAVASAVAAAVLAPLIAASVGVGTLLAAGALEGAPLGKLWLTWWAGDALGALTVTPAVLVLPGVLASVRRLQASHVWRAAVILATAGVAGWLTFAVPEGGVFLFTIFPVLLLASAWFGAAGVRLLAVTLSIGGLGAAFAGYGPFVGGDLNETLLHLQVFLASVAITALALPAFPARRRVLPIAVLLGGWALSGWMFLLLQRDLNARQETFFNERIAEAQAAIRVRMTAYEDALRGGASYFAATRAMDREGWRVYTESLQLRNRYPGINGLGVILVVQPDQMDAWLERVRIPGEPDPVAQPFPNTKEISGQPRYLITYLEGNVAERAPIGRNVATDPSRRAAADLARDAGELRMNHRILGSRDTQRRAGLIVYMPLYSTGATPPTLEARRAAHLGWIYAQVYPDLFLQGVLGPMGETLQLHFFESGGLMRERLLYASAGGGEEALPRFERVTEMEMAGQHFQLGWRRGPRFPAPATSSAVWAATSFALATILLAGLVTSLQSIGDRASAIAAQRTAELAASEERFRTAFENAGIGMALVAPDGRFLRVNRALTAIVGYGEQDLLQKGFQEITHPDDLDADLAHVRELIDGVRSSYQMEKRYYHRDSHVVWIRLTATLVRDRQGTPLHFISQIEDITERKRLEEHLAHARDQALAASRLKSEFLANMSHEIRTPMNAVVGMTGLLAESPLSAEQRSMAHVIQTGAESLLTIINDILDFSKIEAGKLRLERAKFDLLALLDDTLALLAPRAVEKGLTLVPKLAVGTTCAVEGDAGRIRQILTNLLGNAIKFTERGRVEFEATLEQDTPAGARVRFVVRDTGPGIPRDAQANLFQPFVQVATATTRHSGGTGLGLAISRQLADLMGAELGFSSEPGQGATFWLVVDLPRSATTPAPRISRVLIVDDEEADRDWMLHEFAALGVRLETAPGGRAGITAVCAAEERGDPFDLVLLDWQMPGFGGLDTAIELRAQCARSVPLVLMSGGALADPSVASLVGFEAFLSKPVRAEALRRCLRASTRGAAEPPPPVAATRAGPLHLLLVEDTEASQFVGRLLLEKMGHKVDIAANGALALERLRADRYDAVLMDCQMPVLDGYEATRRIRAGDAGAENAHLPIIAVTAYAMRDDRAKCLAAGMSDYITKPINAAQLRGALQRSGLIAGPAEPVAESPRGAQTLDPRTVAAARALPGANGASLWPEMVAHFCADEPERLAQVAAYVAERRGPELAAAAHAFAGEAAAVGAVELRHAALALEKVAREGDWAAVNANAENLRVASGRAREALARA